MEGTPTAVVPATPVTITAAARRPPDVNQLAVRQQLDVKEIHGRVLEKFDTVRDKKLEPKHAALFFENIVKAPNTAQQLTGNCMACSVSIASTGSFKLHSHILKCPLMPAAVKQGFQALRAQSESKQVAKRDLLVPGAHLHG